MGPYLILGFPLVIYLMARVSLPNVRYEFDIQTHGSFGFLHDRFHKIAWMIFGFGFVSAFAAERFLPISDAPVILLVSAIFALLFNVWLTTSYESYMHSRYGRGGGVGPSNYTLPRYCVTITLGVSCLVLFVVGSAVALMSMR